MLSMTKRLKAFFGRTPTSSPKKRRTILVVERLEGRDLLSALSVISLGTGGNGSSLDDQASSGDSSPVNSSVSTPFGSANASASMFELSAAATGANGISNGPSSSALANLDFQIVGVPAGTQVPLEFSYDTSLIPIAVAPGFGPIAGALASYTASAGSARQGGEENIARADGRVTDIVTGDVGGSHMIAATFVGSGVVSFEVSVVASASPGASSTSNATLGFQGVTSPLASQYPDLALQFDDGQSLGIGPDFSLQDNGPASDMPGNDQVGEPIDINTGNVFQSVQDYSSAGSNSLSFTRYYNTYSLPNDAATTLGEQWRSNYDSYLYVNSPTSVTAERATGQVLNFTLENGVWTTDSDVDYTLAQSGSNWTLTDPQNNVETYTDNGSGLGLLDTIQARDGYTQTLQRNGTGQLTAVTDSFGRELSIIYQGGLLSTVTTPTGLVISYGYGSGPRGLEELTSVTDSTTPQTSLTYDYYSTGLLKDLFDQDGNTYVSYAYDSQNRATQVYMGGTSQIDNVKVSYNDANGSRTVTDANGLQTVYDFAILQGVPKVTQIERLPSGGTPTTSSYTYDANGYVASYTDWNGNVAQFVNDSRGLPVSVTEAAGTPLARTTTISYLPNFNLPAQIATPGLTTDFAYDSNGNLLTPPL